MSDLYWLTDEQMARLQPFFPKSHGRPRVDVRVRRARFGGCIETHRQTVQEGCAEHVWVPALSQADAYAISAKLPRGFPESRKSRSPQAA